MSAKKILSGLFLLPSLLFAQVGIGTTSPNATLELVGKPSEVGVADGFIAPRISRANLIAKTAYTTVQIGAIVYVSDLSGTTNTATQNIIEVGYYNFNGTRWESMNSNSSKFHFGDIKQGFQANDHSGWIKLDGRAKSTLTAAQQTQATALGIGTNLPNATDAYLVQNGTVIGSVSGSNSKTIVRSNLPNVTLTGTTSTDGSHTHTMNVNDNSVITTGQGAVAMKEGQNNWTSGAAASSPTVIASSGSHSHSFTTTSLNNNVIQTSLDITPKSLSVNTFIYLGN